MAFRTTGDTSYDVPDSTDWIGTPLAGLMPVEAAFRCHVCKDFYNSPMLTSCNHTFCSLCIRRCLSADGKCPLCRKNDQEIKLRGDWALREAVDAFVACRSAILEFARKPAVTAPASPKRKAAELEEEDLQEPTSKRTRMSTRSSARRGAAATASMAQEEADQPGSSEPADAYTPDDGLVACPICWTRMKEADVSRHIDTSCPGSPSKRKPQASKPPPIQNNFLAPKTKPSEAAKPPERLPGLNYAMLKDQALRKKLMDLGINSYGSRQHMERRHKEWVTLWNANCDSAHPKTRDQLLQDLDVWERTVGTGTRSLSMYGQQQAPLVKDKNFDGSAWATKHDDSFKDLIANARRSKQKAEEKAKEATPPVAAPPKRETSGLPSEPHTNSREQPGIAQQVEPERRSDSERVDQPPPGPSTSSTEYTQWLRFDPVSNFHAPKPEPTPQLAAAWPGSITTNSPTPAPVNGPNGGPTYGSHFQGYHQSRPAYEYQHTLRTQISEPVAQHTPAAESVVVANTQLPFMVNTGSFSQPTPTLQRGVDQPPSFSSSFDNFMAKRLSQEPSPSLTEQAPPR